MKAKYIQLYIIICFALLGCEQEKAESEPELFKKVCTQSLNFSTELQVVKDEKTGYEYIIVYYNSSVAIVRRGN